MKVTLFLLGLLAFNSLWALAGGQYHLDLMFWPWKLGFSLIGAALIVMIATASGKKAVLAALLLTLIMAAAGFVTYYYHLNEPTDTESDPGDQVTSLQAPYQTRQPSAPFTIG